MIASGTVLSTVRPHRIFASSTTAFCLALKPSLRISIDEAAQIYGLPDLQSVVTDHFFRTSYSAERRVVDPTTDKIQTWFKVRVQQPSCHDRRSLEPPQSLMASPPSPRHPNGRYDFAIISQTDENNWPSAGLTGTLQQCVCHMFTIAHYFTGHAVVQIHLIFCLLCRSTFFAYVQRFNHTFPPLSCNTTDGAAGLHGLKWVIRHNGM